MPLNAATSTRVLMLLENSVYPHDPRVLAEATALTGAGYRVTVIAPALPGQPLAEMLDGVRVCRFPFRTSGRGLLGYLWEYGYAMAATFAISLAIFVRHGFDVVHANNPPDTFVVIAAFYKLFGVRFVFDHHDLSPEMYYARFGGRGRRAIYWGLMLFEKLSCRLADHVIATNESYKAIEMTRGGVPAHRITIVRNGPNLERVHPVAADAALRARAPSIVGYMGAMGVQDGVDYLLRALRHLVYDLGRRDVFCVLIGPEDPALGLGALITELGLDDHVWRTGYIPHADLLRYLSTADICVDPDPSNPFNDRCTMTKMMVYMALEKPIVAFDLPEHRVTAQEAAVYVTPNDEQRFARAMADLLDDPQRRRAMGEFGRRRVESSLAWSHSVPALLQAYRTVTARAVSPAGTLSSVRTHGVSVLPIDDERWSRFVESSPEALPFHHPSWANLLAECYGYRPLAMVLHDADGIAAGLPVLEIRTLLGRRRWSSLPFTDFAPPLARDECRMAALAAGLDAARRAERIPQLEVRAPVDGAEVRTQPAGVVHRLRLASDHAAVFRTFKRTSVQQRIEKAEREGVVVRRGIAKEDLTQVFYALHLATRRRLGVPVQPRRFFELLWDRMLAPGHGFLLLAFWNGIPVAGAVFLTWNGTITYKYSASRHEFWHLRPNNLVIWQAIRWGCENGFHTFDFGRTEPGNDGLRAFKSGWGTTEAPLAYSTLSGRAPSRMRGHAAAILRWPIQKLPPWFCRLVGELAYGRAA